MNKKYHNLYLSIKYYDVLENALTLFYKHNGKVVCDCRAPNQLIYVCSIETTIKILSNYVYENLFETIITRETFLEAIYFNLRK